MKYQTLKSHFKTYRLRYILGLILIVLISGVSFVRILDKTKKKRTRRIEYIVVHYTANLNPGADAVMNATYLRNKENAGCHYCIDDQQIIQCTDEQNVAYSIGDRMWLGFVPKKWFMDGDKRKILNNNSLNYEMCLGGGRNDSLILETTAQQIGWQLVNKGLDLSRVVRHHDVTGKHCPRFCYQDKEWDQKKEDGQWWKFRQRVKFYQEIHLRLKEERKLQQAKF